MEPMKILKVTTPESMVDNSPLTDAVNKFEEKFKSADKNLDFYFLIIHGEYSPIICQQVAELYKSVGWAQATCITSSQNGERPGLTCLKLHRVCDTY